MNNSWFSEARFGLFVHFGLYSLLERGEWVMNREGILPEELLSLADRFEPSAFDAGEIADLAVAGGMKYLIFTTMHHEGFRMYHSDLTDFCSTKIGPKRDFTAELIQAARERGLKVGLYHSLNNWFDQPDAVAALEDQSAYETFIGQTLARIRELVTRYNPIDILWYDGWWPFNATQWQAERMNEMVRSIQPHVLINGRNGLPGDFATPEQHLTPPQPWRPWEACVTINDNWGYHSGDQNWKSPVEIIKMLAQVAQGKGNLLLNIGPCGDGSIPRESVETIHAVGDWLRKNGECIAGTDLWTMDPHYRGKHRGDWSNHGLFTVRGNVLYQVLTSEPEGKLIIRGLETEVQNVTGLGIGALSFSHKGDRVEIVLSDFDPAPRPRVIRLQCRETVSLYGTGGMRHPRVPHPRYDPVPSDISW